jgi:hypothetical protein
MASDAKPSPPAMSPALKHRDHGIRIFTYPKVIFIFPTMIAALICGIGMTLNRDEVADPIKTGAFKAEAAAEPAKAGQAAGQAPNVMLKHRRFLTSQNLLGVLFLGIFAFNLLIMAIDFPRFTVVAILLLVLLALFVLLWIGAYFNYDLMRPARHLLGNIYTVANSGFYFMFATIVGVMLAIVYITRYLDFWEILPNEILHHHGPLSDLERFPTMNLKFDKEIPDVLEYIMGLGAGRIVLHVGNERKAIVLDNVLWIDEKERKLKNLMGRLEVRVTTDQEMVTE